jgi:membrane-associated phospholipid phosphatase
MRRVLTILFLLACLFVPLLAHAQPVSGDGLTPPFPTQTERKIADVASYGTVAAALLLDTRASWNSPERSKALAYEGARLGGVYLTSYVLKKLVARNRPCNPSCGVDDPHASFPSMHTMFAFSARGGPSLSVSLALGAGTAAGRIGANKHFLTDTLAGMAGGLGWSLLRP